MQFYLRSDSVVSRMIAGETLIVPVRKGVGDLASIYSLNEVGSRIWEAISQQRGREEILDCLEHEFDGDRGQMKDDLEIFLAEMASAGLVRVAGACE